MFSFIVPIRLYELEFSQVWSEQSTRCNQVDYRWQKMKASNRIVLVETLKCCSPTTLFLFEPKVKNIFFISRATGACSDWSHRCHLSIDRWLSGRVLNFRWILWIETFNKSSDIPCLIDQPLGYCKTIRRIALGFYRLW